MNYLIVSVFVLVSTTVATAAGNNANNRTSNKTSATTTTTTSTSTTTNTATNKPRAVSSEEAQVAPAPSARSVASDTFIKVTGSLGYSNLGSNDSREIAARNFSGYNQNALGSLSVEGQHGRYFGYEAEGYLGYGLMRSYSTVDKVTGQIDTKNRSLSQRGLMLDVQVRYPLTRFRRDWGWHMGLGYGWGAVSGTGPALTAQTVDNSALNVNGAYATLGYEVRVVREICMGVDYAISLWGGSTRVDTTAGTPASTNYTFGQFDRLRVQLAYVIDADWRAGLMYTRRMIKGSNSTTEDSEVGNQLLATLQVVL